MDIVGIYFDAGLYYIAGMTQQSTLSFFEVKKTLDKEYPWSVSLLKEVAFKSFKAPTKMKRALLAAVPFQAERLLPFPYGEAVVIPVIEGNKVTLFAAKKEALKKHLDLWDTPFVSCPQMALYRYARWAYPHKTEGIFYIEGEKESFFISIEKGYLEKGSFLMAPYDEEAKKRVFDYLGSLERIKVEPRGMAMGLALDVIKKEGKSTQFRQGEWTHPLVKQREQKKKKSTLITYVAALMSMGFLMWSLGVKDERNLLKAKEAFAKTYSYDMGALVQLKEKKLNFYSEPPRVSAILAYLEQFHHLVDVDSIKIELLQYPTLKESEKKYKVQVKLHFQSVSAQGAKLFQDHLTGKNRWVDGKEEIEFKRFSDGYQATFILAN